MLGYENDFSLYRIYKLLSRKVFSIRNVKFDESVFPGLTGQSPIGEEELLDEVEEVDEDTDLETPVTPPPPVPEGNPTSAPEEAAQPVPTRKRSSGLLNGE
ncbi:hypothetical protein MJO29_006168 [Puccinia striiformis f. sp. tritici]|nr:hypothetical protein MJO29_006168 [Puccinia striiformis f. sp. tritici]